ncbi:Nucleotide-sugar transporter [Ostreococcus tauri]|uniref:Nucleotide-sugar transporter n=1 Tax=Ostreococcus tauri TaxID=70448 RepID=A0A096PAI9_OSTTA|nr:Nucleotide-sugar transporter [Ostreococcus tauri]OUS41811.1 nucleotide-sugar transporter-domain-containing protein [Ostreococcus tauri]CEG01293.1 Nucleotide-sugar transporter [Ostreococcus tauri]|eukprot:XP_003075359.2 Nucleotide-sugar transporter [Ostreococcus tauri]
MARDGVDGENDLVRLPSFRVLKIASCVLLLFFTVSATIFTEASKREDGTYAYDTFVIPCVVEAVKLVVSSALLARERVVHAHSRAPLGFTVRGFAAYSFPALCYFVSNNCMFYIIRYLGASTFQIMNNLKVLSTGVFMYVFLDRKLSWAQWKALIMLVIGCMVTQLNAKAVEGDDAENRSTLAGYALVLTSAVASGAGGVFSERLLKGKGADQQKANGVGASIHWQNMQLYVFGLLFGVISLRMDAKKSASSPGGNIFDGFNAYAYATVATLAICGLLVSFILKYLDNVAKCFCAALSMLCVALLDSAMKSETIPLSVVLGIVLTALALEQYNLS